VIRLHVLRSGKALEKLKNVEAAKEALAENSPGTVVWADLEGRSPESDAILADVFGFHELAIEDVYKENHRPKVEDYDEYLYLIVRAVLDASRLEDVISEEVDLFLGPNFVVTHHSAALPDISAISDELSQKRRLRGEGPAFLAHAVLDRVVDGFRPLADRYMNEVDRLETEVLAGEDHLARIVELKGALHRLRRICAVQRNVLLRLARAEFDEIPTEAKPFFRDVHEHMAQLTDAIENERDELNAVFDAFHSLSAHRMNEIMKVLTLISTIMLPLTFLAGVYGMNFKYMPELNWQYSYEVLWAVMIGIAVGMTGYFRYRRWL
jgi:magnesium transporter